MGRYIHHIENIYNKHIDKCKTWGIQFHKILTYISFHSCKILIPNKLEKKKQERKIQQ